uniref:Protodermal factor 1 n=1 Tax=Chenopodium quinoa TaxID=63459 RepID=A0A803LRM5_CHEQI
MSRCHEDTKSRFTKDEGSRAEGRLLNLVTAANCRRTVDEQTARRTDEVTNTRSHEGGRTKAQGRLLNLVTAANKGGSGGSHHPPRHTPSNPPSGGGCACPSPPPTSGGSGGYYPPTPTTPRTPTPVIVTPPSPLVPTTPPRSGGSGSGGYYPPTTPSSPLVPSPPVTPIVPTPPYLPDPNTPPMPFDPTTPPFPCTYWGSHPGLVFGVLGWWATVGGVFGVTTLPGLSSATSLQEMLNNPRNDGYGSLYREGTASFLNSMASKNFALSTKQVKDSFLASLASDK